MSLYTLINIELRVSVCGHLGAEEKFKEIGAAYETLKDPVKKWDFDNKREGELFHLETEL